MNEPWRRQYPDMTEVFKGMELRNEHRVLKDAVVEAAKAWNELETRYGGDLAGALKQYRDLRTSTDALNAFEASHAKE